MLHKKAMQYGAERRKEHIKTIEPYEQNENVLNIQFHRARRPIPSCATCAYCIYYCSLIITFTSSLFFLSYRSTMSHIWCSFFVPVHYFTVLFIISLPFDLTKEQLIENLFAFTNIYKPFSWARECKTYSFLRNGDYVTASKFPLFWKKILTIFT